LTDAAVPPIENAPDEPAPPPPPPVVELPPAVVTRRADLIAVASLVAIVTFSFIPVLLGFENFYMRDLTRYYYPTKQILREIVYGGEFPYWNRYFHAGQPIAANPEHEVFYPFTWLILLPSYDLGYRLHILIHLYIGVLGMYALMRSMRCGAEGSWFAAVSFGMGGLYLSYINLLPILFCAAWLPFTCLYLRRFLETRRIRHFALASLFLGMQFLVGEPTTVMQTGLILGMYAMYRGWYATRRWVAMAGNVAWVGLVSITGLAIGAAQILPAVDHVGASARSRPFEFDLVSAWSMPWAKYAELIFPNVLGHISVKQVMWYWGGGLYPGMGSPFLFSIYAGLAVMAFAVGSALTRPRGGRFVLLLCILSSLLALGGHTPLLRLLYKAGIATSIRYPEKFALIGVFAITIFAARMVDRMLRGDDAVRDGATGFAIAVAVVATSIAITTFTPLYDRTFMHIWGLTPHAGTTRQIALSKQDWIIAAVRGILLVAILFGSRLRFRRTWLVVAASFVVADLTLATYELNPRMPRRFFDPPPASRDLPGNRADYRLFHEADWYGTEEIARQYFSTADAVYWVVRNGLFPMTPAGAKIRTVMERDYDKTSLIPTIDFTDSVWDVKRAGRVQWWEPFMGMSNAWYRSMYRPIAEERKRNKGNFKASLPMRFIPAEHYPRYYFTNQLVTIKDRADFVKKLTTEKFSSKVAFVKRKSFVPGEGTIVSVRETANTAILDVESRGRNFLVMSVTPHKYWHVTIDGKPVAAEITNIGYQGVEVADGRHRIEMRYANSLVRLGLVISIATAAVMLLIVMFTRFTGVTSSNSTYVLPAVER
jgi:hypothetical protein